MLAPSRGPGQKEVQEFSVVLKNLNPTPKLQQRSLHQLVSTVATLNPKPYSKPSQLFVSKCWETKRISVGSKETL